MSIVQEVYTGSFAKRTGIGAKRPRLLYLITRAERGGAQMHLLDLALGMRDQFEIEVATGEEGFLTDACRELGIPVHVLPSLEREIKPLSDLRALWELNALMRAIEPDLVHAHTFKAGFLGRLASKYLKIASVYTVHMWPFGRAVPLSWRLTAPICERLASHWCDRIISVSELGVQDAVEFRIARRSQLTSILSGIPDHPARAILDHDGELSCTMVARFTDFKDHRLLLKAFVRVSENATLRLVGNGDTLVSARKLAADLGISHRVRFEGSRGDVPEILADTDVFVLASKTETLPISILEAMRAGLPVIASDVGGVSEEVVDNETGLLVAPGSVEELSNALDRLLANKSMRMAMGRAGRKRFEDLFQAEKMIEQTEAVYRRVLAERFAPE